MTVQRPDGVRRAASAVVGVALCGGLCVVLLGACAAERRRTVDRSGGGITLRTTPGAAEPGLVLASARVEVEVETPLPRRRQPRAGHVRRLGFVGDAGPRIRDLLTTVEVDGLLAEVDATAVRAVRRHGRPALRVEAIARADGRTYRLVTELQIDPVAPVVKMRTRVQRTEGPPERTLRVADRIDWGGVPSFVPGLGMLQIERRVLVPWVARGAGKGASYVVVPRHRPLLLWLREEPQGPRDVVAMGEPLGDGRGVHERRIALAREDVAPTAWALLGEPFRRIRGRVLGPLQGAEVVALASNGAPEALTTPASDGTFALTVRAGVYQVVVEASTGEADVQADVRTDDADVVMVVPTGGRLVVAVRDGDGNTVPARLVIRGIRPTPDPVLGPDYRADGARRTLCLPDGPVEVPLRPGRYEVTATHGPEYSIAQRDVSVPGGRMTRLDLLLRREVEVEGALAGDFHVHAEFSPDSLVSLRDRVRSLLCEGVEIAVPTDHNHVTDYSATLAALGASRRMATAPGIELTTAEPGIGHFNVYPVNPAQQAMPTVIGTTPAALFAAVRAIYPGAVLQINHPRMGSIGYFERMGLDAASGRASGTGYSADFDVIEVWNGFDLDNPERVEQNLADFIQILARGVRVTGVGNSDSHRIWNQWIGYPRTYVRLGTEDPAEVTPEALAKAMREGRVPVVTNGPILELDVDGSGPGATVHADGPSVTARVRLSAASWIDTTEVTLVAGGAVAARWEVERANVVRSGLRGEWEAQIPVERSTFVLAIARGEIPLSPIQPDRSGPPLAFTNPVFVLPSTLGR